MGRPEGFEYVERGEDVVILHHGRPATTLRGRRASDFLEDVDGLGGGGSSADAQELMARLTGNYRRGNERAAKHHPRNAGR